MINYNYLYKLLVVTVAELNCHQLIYSSANIQCNFISTLGKDIFVATKNTFPSINALEHVYKRLHLYYRFLLFIHMSVLKNTHA